MVNQYISEHAGDTSITNGDTPWFPGRKGQPCRNLRLVTDPRVGIRNLEKSLTGRPYDYRGSDEILEKETRDDTIKAGDVVDESIIIRLEQADHNLLNRDTAFLQL